MVWWSSRRRPVKPLDGRPCCPPNHGFTSPPGAIMVACGLDGLELCPGRANHGLDAQAVQTMVSWPNAIDQHTTVPTSLTFK